MEREVTFSGQLSTSCCGHWFKVCLDTKSNHNSSPLICIPVYFVLGMKLVPLCSNMARLPISLCQHALYRLCINWSICLHCFQAFVLVESKSLPLVSRFPYMGLSYSKPFKWCLEECQAFNKILLCSTIGYVGIFFSPNNCVISATVNSSTDAE